MPSAGTCESGYGGEQADRSVFSLPPMLGRREFTPVSRWQSGVNSGALEPAYLGLNLLNQLCHFRQVASPLWASVQALRWLVLASSTCLRSFCEDSLRSFIHSLLRRCLLSTSSAPGTPLGALDTAGNKKKSLLSQNSHPSGDRE